GSCPRSPPSQSPAGNWWRNQQTRHHVGFHSTSRSSESRAAESQERGRASATLSPRASCDGSDHGHAARQAATDSETATHSDSVILVQRLGLQPLLPEQKLVPVQ